MSIRRPTTHTPGPWTIEEYGDEDARALVIHKDVDTRVCFMATPGLHGDLARIEADARLIAAAPDLLAAIISSDDAHWTPAMRAAIAKATGQKTLEGT